MSDDTHGLVSPWDTDQSALNAAEIMTEMKSGTAKFRELPEQCLRCDCSKSGGNNQKVLVRVFVGPDDDGVVRAWVWVPGQRTGSGRVPPLAIPVPQAAGEKGWTMNAQCPRCQTGWLLMLGADGPGTVRRLRMPAPTRGRVVD